ncbi:enoyl-[acyl-carrier-protein] reductase [NADPH] FabL [bacterium BMS3Abin05]|nr:enoyl-[acyl-carrier-protein] reductase [NADPH] FabL [bacterium BMS3Abin05]GBE26259.1 enoyl-[acyl-carrier-protein] reductase [NADPH] FabL [bacterium BMS3Bbin03]HDZ12033.1 SDR family NAD(P)-dependent oxidoreductase [Bacteroidota bacterium]
MELKNRVIIITGAAQRVGKAIAARLAEDSPKLVIHYNRSVVSARKFVRELQGKNVEAVALQADLADPFQIRRLVAQTVDRFGTVDVLINNAAVFYRTPFPDISEHDWEKFMRVNLRAPFLLSREVSKIMLEKGNGKIINIADVGGIRPWANFIPYSVSKAGLIMLTQALAKALAPKVTVNAVAPGPVLLPENYTDEQKAISSEQTLLKRVGNLRDVTEAIYFLLAGSDFMTGAVIPVDGGRAIL